MKPISDGSQAFIDNKDYLYKTLSEEEQENYREQWSRHHSKALKNDMSGDYKAELWAQQLEEIEADYRRQCFEEIAEDQKARAKQSLVAFGIACLGVGFALCWVVLEVASK